MQKSPLAPVVMPQAIPVEGVRWASMAAGLRYKDRDDLSLIVFDQNASIAGVFTKSSTAGHPVLWCREMIKTGTARAILVNAGNANVFRGQEGDWAVEQSAQALSTLLDCHVSDILVASTGVIGERLPIEKLNEALPELIKRLSSGHMTSMAQAIMTTDTFPKWSSIETEIAGQPVKIAGIAKGSGMIAPDMATMLAFLVTDAALDVSVIQELIKSCADQSFNAITVDSDTSTSDTLLLAATHKAGNPTIDNIDDPRLEDFGLALLKLMQELALMVVRDGEGAQKLIEISVRGAVDDGSARIIGKAIANSPLVKTAIAGEDANWGRVIMAIGKSEQPIELAELSIAFGEHQVATDGQAVKDRDESLIDAYLKGNQIEIDVIVGKGPGSATIWTCDLTHGYIDINADYRS